MTSHDHNAIMFTFSLKYYIKKMKRIAAQT